MGDEVADDWNSAQMREIVKAELSELNQNDDDVPDDWEDEPEEEPEPSPPKVEKKVKPKPVELEPDFSKMTEKEKEQYRAEQEMKAYGYTELGNGETGVSLLAELKCTDENSIKATTSELMRKIIAVVPKTLQQTFVSVAFIELCAPLQSREVRQLSLTLKAMADVKKKGEDVKKAAKKKPMVKLAASKATSSMYDDYDEFGVDVSRNDSFDDFM